MKASILGGKVTLASNSNRHTDIDTWKRKQARLAEEAAASKGSMRHSEQNPHAEREGPTSSPGHPGNGWVRAGQAGWVPGGHVVGNRSFSVVLTGPLCAGELSCHDPGECSDGSQGPHVQERRCTLVCGKGQGPLTPGNSRPFGHPHPDGPSLFMGQATLSRRKLGVQGLWTTAPSLPPSAPWSEGMGVIERHCLVLRVWGKQLLLPNSPAGR